MDATLVVKKETLTIRPEPFAVFLLTVLLFALPLTAKQKEREWQTGKVIDTGRGSVYAGNVGSASGSSTTNGDKTYGEASGSSTAIYRVYETYTIESEDYIYVCEELVKWRWSKPALVTVNGPVQFAVEKDHIYIKGEDGKEHKARLIKKTLKGPQNPSK